jgi:serine/threonine-protein kinase
MLQARRYEFHELLGRGGMGEVYRGTAVGAHGFAKPVAIKRVRRELADSEWFVERLVAEAKLLSALQHSNLVSVLDLGRSEDDVFIALEYVDGPDLGSLLKDGPLPLGLSCFVIRSACEGVAFAHQRPQPVIHADLSPSNVLLSRAGEVKVTDFGIARQVGGQHQPSGIEGKWPYMAPEQLRGEPLTPLSDVFSMGVVLYRVLTRGRPFDGDDEDEVCEAILSKDPAPPSKLRRGIPEALDVLCLQALHKDPAERFQSMRALGNALGEIAFGQGWRDGPAELAALIAERMPPPPVRRPTSLKVILGELGVGAATATRQTTPDRPQKGGVPEQGGAELTGSVVARTSGELDGLTRWTVQVKKAAPWRVLVAAGAVALLAASIFTYLAVSPSTEEPPPRRAGDAPAMALSAPDSQPDTVERSALTVDVAPRDSAPPDVARDLPRKPDVRTAVRRPRGRGILRLHSEPWGYVTIDGRKTGKATPSVHRIRAGRHRVRISSPATGRSSTLTVRISAGQTVTRSVQLRRGR